MAELVQLEETVQYVIRTLECPERIDRRDVQLVGGDWCPTEIPENACKNVRDLQAAIAEAEEMARNCRGAHGCEDLLRGLRAALHLAYDAIRRARAVEADIVLRSQPDEALAICRQAIEQAATAGLPKLVGLHADLVVAMEDLRRGTHGTSKERHSEVREDENWPNQTKTARILELERYKVNRLIKKGVLKTNGKSGRDCRVNPASIVGYGDQESTA
jgi:hypothetical protein